MSQETVPMTRATAVERLYIIHGRIYAPMLIAPSIKRDLSRPILIRPIPKINKIRIRSGTTLIQKTMKARDSSKEVLILLRMYLAVFLDRMEC